VSFSPENRKRTVSPYTVLTAMEAMQEGYDGSGLGLLLRGMEFEDFRYNHKFPILSGIAHSDKAWRRLDDFMENAATS